MPVLSINFNSNIQVAYKNITFVRLRSGFLVAGPQKHLVGQGRSGWCVCVSLRFFLCECVGVGGLVHETTAATAVAAAVVEARAGR
jgi:hypothetical protein